MSLDVVTLSTDADLTTTGAVRALVLGATATSTVQDARFSTLARAAARAVEAQVGYPLPGVQTYREAVASHGRRSLVLRRTPVRAVTAVYDATDTGVATVLTSEVRVEDAEAGILTRDRGFAWSATLLPPGAGGPFYPSAIPIEAWPLSGQEYRPWLVDYVAGWTYNGLTTASANWSTALGTTSTGRTFPEDLELAVALRAQDYFEGGTEVESEKLGDLAVNYRSLGTDRDGRLFTRWRDLVEPYRRVV